MYTVGDFYDAIDRFAPFSLAESWDNSGLLVGSGELPARTALVALDACAAVLEEAKRLGADLIVTHHPVIFQPLKKLDAGGSAYRLAREGISVISAHTNLDVAEGGVNDCLAERLGLFDVQPLRTALREHYLKVAVFVPRGDAQAVYEAMSAAGAGRLGNYSHCGFFTEGEGRFLPLDGASPAIGAVGQAERVEEVRLEMIVPPDKLGAVLSAMKAAHPYEEVAHDIFEDRAVERKWSLGRVGRLPRPMPPAAFAAHVRERIHAPGLRYVAGGEDISTVAVCGGSGGELLALAAGKGAQALVTGEARHQQLLEALERGITLIDAGHHATEAVVLEPLAGKLRQSLPGADIRVSGAADPCAHL